MNEKQQADLLQRWLASGARGEPPAGLDPDTVASIYALRPDLAPAPRLTVDDLLDGLTAGPFATPEPEAEGGGEVVPFPVPASRPPVVPPVAVADPLSPAPGSHRRWWIGGGAGLLAAAAAALLVLSPHDAPTPQRAKVASAPEQTAPADLPAPSAAPAAPAQVAASEVLPDASAGQVVGNAQGGLMGGAIASSNTTAPAAGDLSARTRTAGPTTAGYAAGAAGYVAAPPASPLAEQDAVAAADAEDVQSGGASGWGRADQALNTAVDEKEEARPEPKLATRAASVAAESAAPAPAAASKPTEAPAFDANPVLAAASKLASSDPLAAARQLEPFIRQGTAADGQRIALAAARYARDAGDLDKAEALARAGLARGASGSPDVARLTSLIAAIAQTRAADPAN